MEGPEPPPSSEKKTNVNGCSTNRCNELITNLSQSMTVQRLLRTISAFGSTPVISCLDCTNNNLGINTTTRAVLYDATPLQILVCANVVKEEEVEEAVVHELIHAFDYTAHRCDFNTCEGLAYTEIRAAREAECGPLAKIYLPGGSLGQQWLPSMATDWLRQRCVREHAVRSTANMYSKDQARACVAKVFSDAYFDQQPDVTTPHTDERVS